MPLDVEEWKASVGTDRNSEGSSKSFGTFKLYLLQPRVRLHHAANVQPGWIVFVPEDQVLGRVAVRSKDKSGPRT